MRRTDRMFFLSLAAIVFAWCGCAGAVSAAGDKNRGIELYNLKQYRDAFTELFPLAGRDPQAAYYLANCYQQLGHGAEALDLCKRICTSWPESKEAALALQFVRKSDPHFTLAQPAAATAAAAATGAGKGNFADTPELEKFKKEWIKTWKTLPEKSRIPFAMRHGHMYVRTKINGKDIEIPFDTGATLCSLSRADFPGIVPDDQVNQGKVVPVSVPEGMISAHVVTADVEVENIKRKLPVLVFDVSGKSVVGENFFKEYSYEVDNAYIRLTKSPLPPEVAQEIAQMDAAAGGKTGAVGTAGQAPAAVPGKTAVASKTAVAVTNLAGGTTAPAAAARPAPTGIQMAGASGNNDKFNLPFVNSHNCMVVKIEINGHQVDAIFDTGCAVNGVVLPPGLGRELGLRIHSNGAEIDRLIIGPIVKAGVRVYADYGLDKALIGPPVFGDHRYTVDQAAGCIKFAY
ncbi:MAG: hypothetical protein ACRD3W_30830 [Terriglobales bacterium]